MKKIDTNEKTLDFKILMRSFGVLNETSFARYLKEVWIVSFIN